MATTRRYKFRFHTEEEILFAASAVMEARFKAPEGPCFTSVGAVREFVRLQLSHIEHEVFMVYCLDNQHRLIQAVEHSRGTIDGASVYPREVVKICLRQNAAAVCFAHNHPSGMAEPSAADRHITERLVSALALVEIRVLDHFVVGRPDVVSFAERGWL